MNIEEYQRIERLIDNRAEEIENIITEYNIDIFTLNKMVDDIWAEIQYLTEKIKEEFVDGE